MSSDDDPAGGPADALRGRIYVPEGSAWDAWNAPDGGAVKLAVLATRMEARWLRRPRPRPFGFPPGSSHPVPERIGEAHGAGRLSTGAASVLGFRTAVRTMSIRYGDAADPLAPAAEVISDFHREYQDRDLREALLDTSGTWAGPAEAPDAADADGQVRDSRAEVTPAAIDVTMSGRQRPASVLQLGRFTAFQLREEGVLVTVLARHMGPQFPGIVRLTDLEPMLSKMENIDTELVAEALAEKRREHLEQMRNQTRHGS
jgi:hypothetical protein